MTQEYIPFLEIVEKLKKLCDSRQTGTLFVATKLNRSAQIMIDDGEIVYMYFYNKRGQDALELMATIEAVTFLFHKGTVTSRRGPIPKTSIILQTLAKATGESSTQVSAGAGNSLSRREKSTLEECLAEYIGPMAAIICEDHFGSVADFSTAVDVLAAEIPSVDQRGLFKEKVMARIG
jgi:hypothetical protein